MNQPLAYARYCIGVPMRAVRFSWELIAKPTGGQMLALSKGAQIICLIGAKQSFTKRIS